MLKIKNKIKNNSKSKFIDNINNTKTILTNRGYSIIKSKFSNEELEKIRNDLNVKPYINQDFGVKPKPFPVFLESPKKIYLPKHYAFNLFGEPDLIKVDKGVNINVKFNGDLRDSQKDPVDKFLQSCKEGPFLKNSRGGIISIGCGGGKTVISLYLLSKISKKTLVIVHKEFLLNQWKKRIQEFLPDAKIGIIQASKIDVEGKDIILGMLQSISMKKYDPNIFKDIGFTIIDECHHISSEVFSRALPKINSYYSLGLSATPKRKDGLSKVFHMFLGPTVYSIARKKDKNLKVKVIKYYDNDSQYSKEEVTNYGKLCISKMLTNISKSHNRNLMIVSIMKKLVNDGYQVLVLSDRRAHLKLLFSEAEKFTTVGYYVGGMSQKELEKSESKNIIFGTYPMSSEGLDIPSLNAIIFTTPKSSIEQSIGRITRQSHIKIPIAYDIVDQMSVFPNQYIRRERVYKKLGYSVYQSGINVINNVDEDFFEYFLDKKFILKEFKRKNKKNICLIEDE